MRGDLNSKFKWHEGSIYSDFPLLYYFANRSHRSHTKNIGSRCSSLLNHSRSLIVVFLPFLSLFLLYHVQACTFQNSLCISLTLKLRVAWTFQRVPYYIRATVTVFFKCTLAYLTRAAYIQEWRWVSFPVRPDWADSRQIGRIFAF